MAQAALLNHLFRCLPHKKLHVCRQVERSHLAATLEARLWLEDLSMAVALSFKVAVITERAALPRPWSRVRAQCVFTRHWSTRDFSLLQRDGEWRGGWVPGVQPPDHGYCSHGHDCFGRGCLYMSCKSSAAPTSSFL